MTVCELIYERERNTLSEFAFLTENTRGRDYPINKCDLRGEFQRDRDRIIHSKSFRAADAQDAGLSFAGG